jgi:hypothetical protein
MLYRRPKTTGVIGGLCPARSALVTLRPSGMLHAAAICSARTSRKCYLHTSAQMLQIHPVTGEEDMIGRDLDFDLHNAIQDLIAEGLLEENSDPHRVARIVIHDGYDSLTPAQQALFDAVVTSALRKRAGESEGKRLGVAASY